MSRISIIGGGNMGRAIATIVTRGGNTVEVFNNNDDGDRPVTGDVVFLAVPYPAVAGVLVQRGDQLAGKVVVGVTRNPLNFETFGSRVVPEDTSTATRAASSLPRARVLNARPVPASGKRSASRRSPSPPPRGWYGPVGSPSPSDGVPGWHGAPNEGLSRCWYLGMCVLVLALFALLTLLRA